MADCIAICASLKLLNIGISFRELGVYKLKNTIGSGYNNYIGEKYA